MELRDLFRGLDPTSAVGLVDDIVNRIDAETGLACLDELDDIVADKLIAALEDRS